jgi:hypothetical protein
LALGEARSDLGVELPPHGAELPRHVVALGCQDGVEVGRDVGEDHLRWSAEKNV